MVPGGYGCVAFDPRPDSLGPGRVCDKTRHLRPRQHLHRVRYYQGPQIIPDLLVIETPLKERHLVLLGAQRLGELRLDVRGMGVIERGLLGLRLRSVLESSCELDLRWRRPKEGGDFPLSLQRLPLCQSGARIAEPLDVGGSLFKRLSENANIIGRDMTYHF